MLKLMSFLILLSWFVVHSLQESVPVKLGTCREKISYLWLVIVLTDCTLPADWPVGTERSLCKLKHYFNYKEVCAFWWFVLQQCCYNDGIENVKFLTYTFTCLS